MPRACPKARTPCGDNPAIEKEQPLAILRRFEYRTGGSVSTFLREPPVVLPSTLEILKFAIGQNGPAILCAPTANDEIYYLAFAKNSRPSKAMIALTKEECLDPIRGLFDLQMPEGIANESAMNEVKLGVVTDKAMRAIAGMASHEEMIAIDRKCAAEYKTTWRTLLIDSQTRELARLREQFAAADDDLAKLLSNQVFFRSQIVAILTTERESASHRLRMLERETKLPTNAPPETPDKDEYRRRLAESLVLCWVENPEAKPVLINVMRNFGLRPYGTGGESCEFDGRKHTCDSMVKLRQSCQIVEIGWQYESFNGTFPIVHKALVTPNENREQT